MARSTREGERRVWVIYRHQTNKTLATQGFSDILESTDGRNEQVVETAEQRSNAFISVNPGSKIMAGATTAEQAIEMAHKEKF